MRDRLEQIERQTGRKPQELISPVEFPVLLLHVWSAFIALSNSRTPGFSGANPITYRDILDWKALTHNVLSPRDVQAIMELDGVYLKIMNKD